MSSGSRRQWEDAKERNGDKNGKVGPRRGSGTEGFLRSFLYVLVCHFLFSL